MGYAISLYLEYIQYGLLNHSRIIISRGISIASQNIIKAALAGTYKETISKTSATKNHTKVIPTFLEIVIVADYSKLSFIKLMF